MRFLSHAAVGLSTIALMASTGCDKKDPVIPNPEELITTIIYELTPLGGGTTLQLTFRDLDGDGGDSPTITTDPLSVNTAYTGTLTLLDESQIPAEDISEEVRDEGTSHQFFFSITQADLMVEYTDSDNDGRPVGLTTELTAGSATTGQLTITLRHEPDKSAPGVADGDIANAGGETDIEVTFPVTIQ